VEGCPTDLENDGLDADVPTCGVPMPRVPSTKIFLLGFGCAGVLKVSTMVAGEQTASTQGCGARTFQRTQVRIPEILRKALVPKTVPAHYFPTVEGNCSLQYYYLFTPTGFLS